MTCGFLINLYSAKESMWFIGVTPLRSGAPPPKKNPGEMDLPMRYIIEFFILYKILF